MENTVPAPSLVVPGLHAASPCSLAGGDAQAVAMQSPAERGLLEGSSVTMTCQLSNENLVHWYRQLSGKPLSSQKLSILIINDVSPDDAATYYCAYGTHTVIDAQRPSSHKTPSTTQLQLQSEPEDCYCLIPPSLLTPSAISCYPEQILHGCRESQTIKGWKGPLEIIQSILPMCFL
uniref:Ig-like domain-containing protein n=1 Tax=Phasianus colchicus TaxID=9054 RepID=A0A669R0L7_PHACC